MTVLARKIGKQIIPVVEKFTELEADRPPRRGAERPAGHRRARQAGGPRRRPLEVQRRLPLQVRPDADRGAGGARVPQAARHGRLPAAGPLPPRQPDHQHPQHQGRPDRGGPRLRRAAPRRRRRPATSTSAAASASTTTARRPTSSRRSTTRCRNTPTTSSSASRASATRPACRTRRSSPSRAGPWSPTTACWSSTCSASPTSTATRSPPEIPADAPQQITDLFAIHRDLSKKNLLESYHDAVQAVDEALNLFNLGSPDHRACAPWSERLFWAVCGKLLQAGPRAGLRAGGAAGPGGAAVGHLLLQLLDLPVDAGQLGDQAALPDHADPSAERGADAAGGAGRHHLRLGRQDRPVHRPARRAQHAASCTPSTASPTTWAPSCSGPTRRSSATCTTCSATPTRSTSASTRTARSTSTTSSRATRSARCWTTCSTPPTS